jgi:hypothetical protein
MFFWKWLGGTNPALPKINWEGSSCLTPTFFWRQWASTKGSARALVPFFGGVVFMTFFSNFFYLRGISVGAFSELKIPKPRGASPEMPKTGSPLAKGELINTAVLVFFTPQAHDIGSPPPQALGTGFRARMANPGQNYQKQKQK